MYPNHGRRSSRSWNSFEKRSYSGSQTPLQRSSSLGSMQALDGSEGIKYEGNLQRFYRQRANESRSATDPREQMVNTMRAQVTAQRRINPNEKPFYSTIVPQFKQNREEIRSKRRERRKLRKKLKKVENDPAKTWHRESVTRQNETDIQGKVYDDDTDLYWDRDQQFRNRYQESQSSNRIGHGVNDSYTIRSRLMDPIVQRSPTMRDRLDRNMASYQVREAQTPKYQSDRQQRIRNRRIPPFLSSTLQQNRTLSPIPEVRDIDEQCWYTLDELD